MISLRPIHEHNDCHSPKDGRFCATRGGQRRKDRSASAADQLVAMFKTTDDPVSTHFVTPDGSRINLDSSGSSHEEAAHALGLGLGQLLHTGVARSRGGGWEFGAVPTERQAQIAVDDYLILGGDDLFVDVTSEDGVLLGTKKFTRPTVDGIRNFVVGTLRKAVGGPGSGNFVRKKSKRVKMARESYLREPTRKRVREFNACHDPQTGRFSGRGSCGGMVAGITSFRPAEDVAHHRSHREVYREMDRLAEGLRRIPGVSNVHVTPALGQWGEGEEPAWSVQYLGNGQARRLLADVGMRWNQDAVLLAKPCRGQCDRLLEYSFDRAIPLSFRRRLAPLMAKAGFGGWAWVKKNGQTTLRIMEVPEFGATPEAFTKATQRLNRILNAVKLRPRVTQRDVTTEVLWHPDRKHGKTSYAEV